MIVTEDQTQQIAFNNNILSLYTCKIDQINFKGQYTHVYNPQSNRKI